MVERYSSKGEEAIPTKPDPKRIYNTVGFRKRKRCLSRHKKGKQKQTTHEFSARRDAIGIPNANAQQIASTRQPSDSYKGRCKDGEELFEKGI